jgi:dienelactone hydrolase
LRLLALVLLFGGVSEVRAAPVQPFVVAIAPLPLAEATRGEVQRDERGNTWEQHLIEGQVYWLYVPQGKPPAEGWPAVIVPPAGTNLLIGMAVGTGDQAEHIPYVDAGYVVVSFDLPGAVPKFQEGTADDAEMLAGYKAFRADSAGVRSAATAFEWLRTRVAQVNADRIFVAGHSSAGTLSLLYCAHEPRLAGCVAYAPVTNLAFFHSSAAVAELSKAGFEGIAEFVPRSSPIGHVATLKPTLYVFYAQDDPHAPGDKEYVRQAQAAGRSIVVKTVGEGGHYDPMIEIGIPAAIGWMADSKR